MVTTYLPCLPRTLNPKQSGLAPWFSPYRLPEKRRSSQTRYARTPGLGKTQLQREVQGFTDASGVGIGVVSDGRWQRWLFNQASELLPRSATTNEIDCRWAELLAAYMGLRTFVASGYYACRIVLRSDNAAVVGLIQRHSGVHPSLWGNLRKTREPYRDLLRRIGELVEKHGLEVTVEWVSTKANLADGPSRGKRLVDEMRLNCGGDVPDDLVDIIVSA